MWAALQKALKDCVTERDSKTYCPFRIGGCALTATGIPAFIGLSIHSAIASQHFDMQAFGMAFATMMGGISALAGTVAFKVRSEGAPSCDSREQ
jgi:hypothetical protein